MKVLARYAFGVDLIAHGHLGVTELLRFLYVFPANSLKEVEYEFLVH